MYRSSRFAVLIVILLLFSALAFVIDIGVAGTWAGIPAAVTQLLSLRTTEDFSHFVETWGAWAMLGSITLMVLHSVLPIPAEIIAVANGTLFGWLWGTAITWTGAMLGAALSFGIARSLGRPTLRRLASAHVHRRIEQWQGRPGYLLMIRLASVISFNLINYAAGVTGLGWWRFLWTTALGILPITVASVVLGQELLEAPWYIWAAIVGGVIILWLVTRLFRAWIIDEWARFKMRSL
jgi:uncharacterized membrane protein YdjX (TVP38/TMEM64 family)